MRDGNAPVLARWIHDDGYRLESWETDWSSQTGACQAGLLHGSNDDMPAFRWWEKDTGRAIVTNHPRDAEEIERRRSDGRGLLYADGASRANILSGDAPHSMLTMSTVLDRKRPGRLGQDYFAYFASPYGVARTLLRVDRRGLHRALVGDPAGPPRRAPADQARLEVRARARLRDGHPARPAGRGGDRRRARRPAGGLHDVPGLRRGRAPLRASSARTRSRCCAGSTRRSTGSPPRSSTRRGRTGSSCSPTTARARARRSSQRYGEGLEDVVAPLRRRARSAPRTRTATRGCASFNAGVSRGRRARHAGRPRGAHRGGQAARARRPDESIPEVSVMASGNLGLISFPREPGRVTLEQLEERRPGLLDALRAHPGIAFVLVRSEQLGPVVLGPRGQRLLRDDTRRGRRPAGARSGRTPPTTCAAPTASSTARTSSSTATTGTSWRRSPPSRSSSARTAGWAAGRRTRSCCTRPSCRGRTGDVVGAATVHRILRGWLAELGQDAYSVSEPPGASVSTRVAGASSAM